MTNNYRTPYELVKEFHLTYGQPVRTSPIFNVPERTLRCALIVEEADEYAVADLENDIVEIFDALADLVYVAAGAAITHGTQTAPKNYNPNTLAANSVPNIFVDGRVQAALRIKEAAATYEALSQNDTTSPEELQTAIDVIIKTCYEVSELFGMNLDVILEEVQRSNMSKLGEDGKPIYRAEDNKVLKGPNFFNPDVAGILQAYGWTTIS